MTFTSKEICNAFFELVEQEEPSSPRGRKRDLYRCKIENCGAERRVEVSSGYSNLLSHIKQAHPDYLDVMPTLLSQNKNSILKYAVKDKAMNTFYWLDWVIGDLREFHFVESSATREYSKLKSISSETLIRHAELLNSTLKEEIAELMRSRPFGIVLDGWEENSSNTEFVAIFAAIAEHKGLILLALTPFTLSDDDNGEGEQEIFNSNDVMFGASQYRELLAATLSEYQTTLEKVCFLVGDNCATNKKLADLCGVPLVGCASHRWALQSSTSNQELETILEQLDQLFSKLRTKKRTMILRTRSNLRPKKRNKTRWSSCYEMLKRFLELLPLIDALFSQDLEITNLIPSRSEIAEIRNALKKAEKLELVTKKLQYSHVPLHRTRAIFEAVMQEFPDMTYYTSYPSPIMHSADFELGVIKILTGKEETLTLRERSAVHCLLLPHNADNLSVADPFNNSLNSRIELALQDACSKNSNYYCLEFIPSSSNEAERLFSRARMIMESRPALSNENLSLQLVLFYNRDLWTVETVRKALNYRT
ncbi:hypothetical protein RCL1_005729 [Eukaryota sp. TZLM3-RCL]